MVRGKPAIVSATGKPPHTPQALQVDQTEAQHLSFFETMERMRDAEMDQSEKKKGGSFSTHPTLLDASTIRGKPPPLRSLEEMDKKIEDQSCKSIAESTIKKYNAKIASLKKWMIDTYGEKDGDRPMEELDFRRFLVTGKDGTAIISTNSIKVWRAAWGFWQDIDPEFDLDFNPAEASRAKRLIKGLRYNAGEGQETDAADPIDSGRLWKRWLIF